MDIDHTVTFVFCSGTERTIRCTEMEANTILGIFASYSSNPKSVSLLHAMYENGEGSMRVLLDQLSGIFAVREATAV